MFKLQILLTIYSLKRYIETKSEQRWYYSRHPRKLAMGFTLAEVLITLLIIGVVASIVIPPIIIDTQDAEFKVAWKKAYSTISQSTKQIMMENGGSMIKLCSVNYDNNCFINNYLPYLNYSKVCYSNFIQDGVAFGNCWHKLDGKSSHWLNGPGVVPNYFVWYDESGLILNDGTLLIFRLSNANCSDTNKGCGYIYVDVNGFKSPNIVGKDIFRLDIFANKVLPVGYTGDLTDSPCVDTPSSNITPGAGLRCSAKYLYQ